MSSDKLQKKSPKTIYISFIEEAVLNPDYCGFIGGRIEVRYSGDAYSSDEIRFFTKRVQQFNRFRNKWDMEEVTPLQLAKIESIVAKNFNE